MSVGAGRWSAGPSQWKVRRRAKPISCVHLCPSAGALRGEELVRRGVLRRLLHGLLPPGNPDPVRKVSLPHGRRVHTIHAFIRCQTITFILLSSFYPIMFPDKLKDLFFLLSNNLIHLKMFFKSLEVGFCGATKNEKIQSGFFKSADASSLFV